MTGSSSDAKLPYSLDKLSWDSAHHFNTQNKYGYAGKGRKLGDAMLQCETCLQWFHAREVSCLTDADVFVPFQRNYRFACRICAGGREQFEPLTNPWSWVVVTAVQNLQLPLEAKNAEVVECTSKLPETRKWVPVAEIVQWIRNHWGSLCHGRAQAQLDDAGAVQKAIAHSEGVLHASSDKSEVSLKSLHPLKLYLKPFKNMPAPSSAAAPPAKPRKDRAGNKKKGSNAPLKRPAPEQPSTNLSEIKLPEKYRLVPAPKTDAVPQDAAVIQLSRSSRAPQVTLRDDMLTAVGFKGYRMVRATHGVRSGSWYFEVRVGQTLNDEDGHTRLGWCTEMGELQAPVGFDANSYSYRDRGGTKFHESVGEGYGEEYGPGDVIGCHLQMGDPPGSVAKRQRIFIKGQEFIVEEERTRVPSAGSSISFFKNGVPQGVAYSEVWAEVYYPAASLYKAAVATFNFGPTFEFPPQGLQDARPMSELPGELLPCCPVATDDADEGGGGGGGGGRGGGGGGGGGVSSLPNGYGVAHPSMLCTSVKSTRDEPR
mmetsp:Transcript_24890/g.82764  ORF Transcript_24890/g.82764 Transcript_24890/m.82764 type:complete len:540 (+) Transcript_24890:46-1665(+)